MGEHTMGLREPIPGLRPITYDARSATKVTVTINPGDELEVPEHIAEQLTKTSPQFKAKKAPAKKAPAKKPPAGKADG